MSEATRAVSEAHVHGAVVDHFSRLTADETSEEGAVSIIKSRGYKTFFMLKLAGKFNCS